MPGGASGGAGIATSPEASSQRPHGTAVRRGMPCGLPTSSFARARTIGPGAVFEAAACGMKAFLLARGVDPGEFTASSLEFLPL